MNFEILGRIRERIAKLREEQKMLESRLTELETAERVVADLIQREQLGEKARVRSKKVERLEGVREPLMPAPAKKTLSVPDLRSMFKALQDQELLERLRERTRGRKPKFSTQMCWRLFVVKYVLDVSYHKLLVAIEQDVDLAQLCFVEDQAHPPEKKTFSAFCKKLRRNQVLVRTCLEPVAKAMGKEPPEFPENVT